MCTVPLFNSSITSVAASSTGIGLWKSNFASARRIWADEEIGAAGPRAMSPIALANACAILLGFRCARLVTAKSQIFYEALHRHRKAVREN